MTSVRLHEYLKETVPGAAQLCCHAPSAREDLSVDEIGSPKNPVVYVVPGTPYTAVWLRQSRCICALLARLMVLSWSETRSHRCFSRLVGVLGALTAALGLLLVSVVLAGALHGMDAYTSWLLFPGGTNCLLGTR